MRLHGIPFLLFLSSFLLLSNFDWTVTRVVTHVPLLQRNARRFPWHGVSRVRLMAVWHTCPLPYSACCFCETRRGHLPSPSLSRAPWRTCLSACSGMPGMGGMGGMPGMGGGMPGMGGMPNMG